MSTNTLPPSPAEIKNDGRDARLSVGYSNQAEWSLRKELNQIATTTCKPASAAFALCSKANGLSVIFNCRKENREMNDCYSRVTNPEAFERYKEMRKEEIMKPPPVEEP